MGPPYITVGHLETVLNLRINRLSLAKLSALDHSVFNGYFRRVTLPIFAIKLNQLFLASSHASFRAIPMDQQERLATVCHRKDGFACLDNNILSFQ